MFTIGLNLILMILGFGLLIFIHELGHFLAAKWAGIRTEAFAVGMGPVVVSWRKGIGFAPGSTRSRVIACTGKEPIELTDAEMNQHNIGETEYSLRWLPIGGFVRMLGQDDANPQATSDDPRSYNRCPIGKRMIVVSAGVIMNILLAAALFVVVFMAGVRFDAPIVGQIDASAPAARVAPTNAQAAGVTAIGLQSGDVVTYVNGRQAKTFADVQIAGAMSRPDVPVRLTVARPGVEHPLHFEIDAERDPVQGLRSIGVMPAYSTKLPRHDRGGAQAEFLKRSGLADQGVEPGMEMIAANGKPISSYAQFQTAVDQSNGQPIVTTWTDGTQQVDATLEVQPQYQLLIYPEFASSESERGIQDMEFGLLGLTPLVRIEQVVPGSANEGTLQDGDVILTLGSAHAPRLRSFRELIVSSAAGPLEMRILRDGEELDITATVRRRGVFDDAGVLNVLPGWAWDVPVMAAPLPRVASRGDDQELRVEPTPVADLQLFEGTRFDAVNGMPVANWAELRAALRAQTADAAAAQSGASVQLEIVHPTPGREREVVTLQLTADDVAGLHQLGWSVELPEMLFEPVQVVRSAGGNPMTALAMGTEETWKMMQLTYLTIDRLFRRTVGVDQLRGPVGIVHIGVSIADRGVLYLVFLLAAISVNLAVINFLPLPIVDGGLFLFLIYEKLKGKPPSVAFQNVATIFGLLLIGTLFLVVTYNDIVRLFS